MGAKFLAVSEREWARRALEEIERAEEAALARAGRFRIALCGGESPREILGLLAERDRDWGRWEIWLADERCGPRGGSNARMIRESLLEPAGLGAEKLEAPRHGLGAEEAAREYARRLEGVGEFDLAVLGLGEDGHAASLFPGRDWGERGGPAALAVEGAPKEPRSRVTMSAWRLSRSRKALALARGAGKREALARWRAGEELPIAAIRPSEGMVAVCGEEAWG